jgi:ATP/maltotriose-dependent transcriptional regulator MalT
MVNREHRTTKESKMNTTSLKPRLVSPNQQASVQRYVAPSVDLRFAAMVQEHQRQRQMLTPREFEVLALLCEGLPNKLIERRLGIGAGTVKCHVANILSKLGVASRLQAVIEAHRQGLLATGDAEDLGEREEVSRSPLNAERSFGGITRSHD